VERGERTTVFLQTGFEPADARTEITETRLEPGVAYRRRLENDNSLTTRLDIEASRLETRSPGGGSDRTTVDIKPTITLAGNSERSQWRALLTRSVTQLPLEEFATNFDEVDDEIQAGNPNLRPQKTWEALASWSYRPDLVDGAITLAASYQQISDLLDFIAGPGDTTIRGNLGSGKAYILDAELSLGLGLIGLSDGELDVQYRWQETSIFDPLLDRHRDFAETPRHTYRVTYDQTFDFLKTQFTLKAEGESEQITVEQDRIDRESINRPYVDAELSWDITRDNELSLTIGNLLDAEDTRERTRFRGTPAQNDVRRIETRTRAVGQTVVLSFRRSF